MSNRSRAREGTITDRERLATAFAELVLRGYQTIDSMAACCSSCGWATFVSDDNLPEDLKAIWWHSQSDSAAFMGDASAIPQTDEIWERIPDSDDYEVIDAWMEEHSDEMEMDSLVARVEVYHTLVAPLMIHWRGDATEIVAALRASGLRVVVPPDESVCIEVLPERIEFHTHAVDGEVLLHLDGHSTQMRVEEVRRLVRTLNRAARQADKQALPPL
jgi:hypothetical protein